MENVQGSFGGIAEWTAPLLLAVPLMAAYLLAAALTGRRYRRWPPLRSSLWCMGVLLSSAAVLGPLAAAAHGSFTAHMLGHLLLGMLGPLLIVLSAPVTLLLRSLPRESARLLTGLLRSRLAAWLSHPVTAALLNVGGLWLLYATDLYAAMHHFAALNALVHVHVFAAGWLFTASVFPVDPAPHRTGMRFRAAVMIAAFAAHGILGKFLYANPPAGTLPEDARSGAQLMYYGGDAVDLLLIILFCRRWYRSAGREIPASGSDLPKKERTASVRKSAKRGIHS
ncbi:cytochrome c oxidase assembly protein [Saccharibacillus sp. VR-M41]|uniref:Cytochrome c oxidase assembly protein n=2 Tax=Saccharibacillus alkalitolerans TaxID=2705290 RepID=A0ABX0F204_9BACL|nr:cytochrome c oxidase assembly protein [Saccharibacillus alkalitolerans]